MKLTVGTVIAGVLLIASTAGATPITLVFDSSLLVGLPGNTVTFVGTVTDVGNSSTFLNADNVSVSSPLLPDDTPFFTNFPAILPPLQFVKAPILNVSIPLTATAGVYSGTLQLLGGATPVSEQVLATQPFAVQVQATTAPVPEPTTALLVLGGVAAALRRARRQRSRDESGRSLIG